MATSIRKIIVSFRKDLTPKVNHVRLLIDIFKGRPPAALAALSLPANGSSSSLPTDQSIESIFNGILYAVPKFRRSIEKRLYRKHRFTSFMEHGTPKTNIVPCLECGNFKEKGHLCNHCYEKVRAETKEMQDMMGDDLKFNVPRSEMEFIYEDEKPVGNGNFIVKMSKTRPSWFSRRLLNKTGS